MTNRLRETSAAGAGPPRGIGLAEAKTFFTAVDARIMTMPPSEARHPALTKPDLAAYFGAASRHMQDAEHCQQRENKATASGFNVFEWITPDENKLSDILAALLNPKGDHGQGDLFLQLFFKRLGICLTTAALRNAKVQREAATHGILRFRRRMDILVDAGVLLAIENKVDALEQEDQVKDYLAHLQYCTTGKVHNGVLIDLTPDGHMPVSVSPRDLQSHQANGRLHCWSYRRELRQWLDDCRRGCAAPKFRNFLGDFIAYIENAMNQQTDAGPLEDADEE